MGSITKSTLQVLGNELFVTMSRREMLDKDSKILVDRNLIESENNNVFFREHVFQRKCTC